MGKAFDRKHTHNFGGFNNTATTQNKFGMTVKPQSAAAGRSTVQF
jgi:hypothetical protein